MKRSILMMVVCLVFAFNGFGQGINFFKGNYQEALEKAAAANKLVFIDFYTRAGLPRTDLWEASCVKAIP